MTAVVLAGNLSEGFVAYGPYADWGDAMELHGDEGWGFTLTPYMRNGMRRFTVVGAYDDANYGDEFGYVSFFWADDAEHAIDQAHNELEETGRAITVVVVLNGEADVEALPTRRAGE